MDVLFVALKVNIQKVQDIIHQDILLGGFAADIKMNVILIPDQLKNQKNLIVVCKIYMINIWMDMIMKFYDLRYMKST